MNAKTDKIKKIYLGIDPKYKNNIRRILSDKFNISFDSAKTNWILNGKIPEQNIDEVLEIVKTEAKKQSDEILQLIDVL